MDADSRVSLPQGWQLTITNEHTGNVCTLTIQGEVGRGGSCIVYRGIQKDIYLGDQSLEKNVILKEFYPKELEDSLSRSEDMLLQVDSSVQWKFEMRLEEFCQGLAKHVLYAGSNSARALPSPEFAGGALGTFYAVSSPGEGQVLSEYDRTLFSLSGALEFAITLCEAIHRIHVGGKDNECRATYSLYLDCKPSNIYICENRAYLFDFDTVQPHDQLRFISYSRGYSAPEQVPDARTGTVQKNRIGYHSDIFALGAVLFELLTGERPEEEVLKSIQEDYDWHQISLKDESNALEDESFLSELDRIMKMILEPDPSLRSDNFGDSRAAVRLGNALKHLIAIAKTAPEKKGFEKTGESIRIAQDSIEERIQDSRDSIGKSIQKSQDSIGKSIQKSQDSIGKSIQKSQDSIGKSIQESRDSIKKDIQRHSLLQFLFGTPGRRLATMAIFLGAGLCFGMLSRVGERAVETVVSIKGRVKESTADTFVSVDGTEMEPGLEGHVLLKLQSANHSYEMGLENWKRLSYHRALKDILSTRNALGEETSQDGLGVAKVNQCLGCLYLDMGSYEKAYDYLNAAYVFFRNALGEESLQARAVRHSIAEYDYQVGKLEDALREIQYILDHSDTRTEKNVIAATKHLKAQILDDQGRYDQALELYEQVLSLYEKIAENGKMRKKLARYASDPKLTQSEKEYYTNCVKWIVLTYCHISQVNLHKEDYGAAADAASAGLALSLDNIYIGKQNLSSSRLYLNLARAQAGEGSLSDALENIDLAMQIQKDLYDFEGVFPGLVEVYEVYGELLQKEGKAKEALNYYKDAFELSLSSFGVTHAQTAQALNCMGTYYMHQKSPQEALPYLQKAVEIQKNNLAQNHPKTAQMYYDLALAQYATGNESGALESLEKVQEICSTCQVEGSLAKKLTAFLEKIPPAR